MADAEHINLPSGVSIIRDCSTLIEYCGTESDLIAAGLLKPEWIDGLGNLSRKIVINPAGGFLVAGEGKGNHLTEQQRLQGAFSIKRLPNGNVALARHRSRGEIEQARDKRNQERNQEAWQLAKQAHSQPDLPARWKSGVLYHIDKAEQLIDGRLGFDDFPDIGIQASDVESAKKTIAELRDILQWATPKIKDKVQRSNVVSLNDAAFRFMKRS